MTTNWDGREKRRFIRANFPCQITIYTPSKHTINTHTKNISAGGVRVIIEEKCDIFSLVGLKIYLNRESRPGVQERGESIACKGRVVWVLEKNHSLNKPHLYDTGIEFYQIDEEDKKIINNFVKAIIKK